MRSYQSQAQSERCLQLLSGGGKSQFVGRWQASTISPCMECSKQVVREEEYNVVGTIGKGSFGSVLLVEERTTGTMFAMKGISKEYMLKKKEQTGEAHSAVHERRIMAAFSFLFLVQLESHFLT